MYVGGQMMRECTVITILNDTGLNEMTRVGSDWCRTRNQLALLPAL
jgi:hypothetical protein